MDEDHEVLDWGNEDDELVNGSSYDRHQVNASIDADPKRSEADDVEDAVSLGGDEDDMQDFMPPYSRAHPNGESSEPPSKSWSNSRVDVGLRDADPAPPVSPRKEATPQIQSPPSQSSPQPGRNLPQKLIHALPPKPVVSNSAFLPLPSTTAASPMSMARRDKDRRANGNAKTPEDALPPDWELRNPRSGGREPYYYNIRTHESTWSHPEAGEAGSPSLRARAGSRVERDSQSMGSRDEGSQTKIHAQPLTAHHVSKENVADPPSSLTYDERHYRPGDLPVQSTNKGVIGGPVDRLVSRVSQGSARLSPEPNVYERAHPAHNDFHHPSGNSSRLRDRESPVPNRDPYVRRMSQRDDVRSGSHAYNGFDAGHDYVQGPGLRDSSRGATSTDRPRRPPSPASHSASFTQDLPAPNRSAGRASTLRRRSPSPRPIGRSPPPNRQLDRGRPSPQLEARPLSLPARPERPPHVRDVYIPADAIPQRRLREPISMSFDTDHDAKRRRTDSRSGDSAPARRAPGDPDTHQAHDSSTASTSPRSAGRHTESNQSRRRAPLPPQSDRYREMAVVPPAAPVPSAPAPAPASARTTLRALPPSSAPSGPRHTSSSAPQREIVPPPDRPSEYRHSDVDYRSRPEPRHGSGRGSGRDRDAMDIDPPYPSRHTNFEDSSHESDYDRPSRAVYESSSRKPSDTDRPQRGLYDEAVYPPSNHGRIGPDDPPRRSPDYEKPQRGQPTATGREPLPRAPRAMGSRSAAISTSASAPQALGPLAPLSYGSVPRQPRERSPPPRARDLHDLPGRPDSVTAASTPDVEFRMRSDAADGSRRLRRDEPPHRALQDESILTHTEHRTSLHSGRGRMFEIPTKPVPKLSGTNSVPIGARKALPSSLPPVPRYDRSPIERLDRHNPFAGPAEPIVGKHGREYSDDEAPRPSQLSQQQLAPRPPSNHMPPPPAPRDRLPQKPQIEPFTAPAPTRQRRDSFPPVTHERVSRFGPPVQRPVEIEPEEDRRWTPRPPPVERTLVVDTVRRAVTPPRRTPPPQASHSRPSYEASGADRYREHAQRGDARPPPLVEEVSHMRVAHDEDESDRRGLPPLRRQERERSPSPGRRSDYPYDRAHANDPPRQRSPTIHREREPFPRRSDVSPYARTQPLPEPRRPASWDRPRSLSPEPARPPPARHVEVVALRVEPRNSSPPAPAPPNDMVTLARTSKPVRIRRPPAPETLLRHAPAPLVEERSAVDRPDLPDPPHLERPLNPRRGPSLLDRLSSDQKPAPAGPGASLRDRVYDDRDQDTVDSSHFRDDDIDGGEGGKGRSKKKSRARKH